MILRFFLTPLLTFSIAGALGALDAPRDPVSPDVKKKGGKEVKASSRNKFQARVTMVGGNRFSGLLKFPKASLTVPAQASVSGKKEVIRLADIKSIRIINWKRYKKRGKAWLFLPYVIKIETNAGTVIHGAVKGLPQRLRCVRDKNTFFLYTIFYDQYHRGRWRNSGRTSFAGIFSRGHDRTVREIHFTKARGGTSPAASLLEMYLKRK